MNQSLNKASLKIFFIKLAAITVSIIIIFNVTYNVFFADKFEVINSILTLKNKKGVEQIKDKMRLEIKNGLSKDNILSKEDKILLYKLYLKIKNEFREVKTN